MTPRPFLLVLSLVAIVGFGACGRKPDHAGHDHGGHTHAAPHGGTMIILGDHAFNLEFVRDATAGTLTAYVLDAHAENFVRLPLPGFAVVATVAGMPQTLALAAVGNPATGETMGDTSQFTAQADWLKTASVFDVRIPALDIRGAKFTNVTFRFPQAAE